jgi:hypothetical protein
MAEKKESKGSIWDELRKPFPAGTVGSIPKGGRTVDFVGHAAVTDRLNNVCGPDNWDWQPLAVDADGLPLLNKKGNLWIKLMVRESAESPWVIRLGYGDGSTSEKELIGDALRNAAMRFGVALDLWSKEELESNLEHPENKNIKPSATAKPAVGSVPVYSVAPKPDVMTENQLKMLMALFNELGITERDERISALSITLGRTIESAKELTKAETAKVIDQLKSDIASLNASEPEASDVDDADIASLMEQAGI